MTEELMTLKEAAPKMGVTRQALYVAIIKGRLKGVRAKNQRKRKEWMVTQQALDDYEASKYCKDLVRVNGEKVWDLEAGKLTCNQAAELMKIPINRLHYLRHSGQLKFYKVGGKIVLLKENLEKIWKNLTKEEII